MSAEMTNLLDTETTPALSGAGLLGLVTTGMYDDPLSMYREYIQNAADAVTGSGFPGNARVDIEIDVTARRVRIRDNGPGLSPEDALERLLPIGRSDKRLGIDRGFRGIGRLAGLAFAKTVSFTTRACEDQVLTRITWHSDRLPELTSTESELEQAIIDCVEVETLSGSEYPSHFFEVEVGDVARYSAGLLLNRDAVRDYIGEVCPVPMSTGFPFAERVEGLFDGAEALLTLEILLEGDPEPVERSYGESVRLSATKEAEFTEFQVVRIPSVDGSCGAAVGWIAHSSYLGAISKEQRVRGIRARVGNIQIGGEAVFDDLFTEERFSRWCVGELHILDPRIIPNARRDYFEPGPHLRNLENQLAPVLRGISSRCRRESAARNRYRKAMSSLCSIEDLYALAATGFLAADDASALVQRALRELDGIRESVGKGSCENSGLERLETVETQLRNFSGGKRLIQFDNMSESEVAIHQKLFGALATLTPSPSSAKELIESVFAEVYRAPKDGSGIELDEGVGSHSQSQLALDDTGELTPS